MPNRKHTYLIENIPWKQRTREHQVFSIHRIFKWTQKQNQKPWCRRFSAWL